MTPDNFTKEKFGAKFLKLLYLLRAVRQFLYKNAKSIESIIYNFLRNHLTFLFSNFLTLLS